MRLRMILPVVALAAAVWALVQAPAPRSLAQYVPAGPLLYLEARDFGALLGDWNASAEKKLWLGSASFEVFSRSRLYQRLGSAQQEFAAAAGLPADMPLVESVAGGESALALYDIGKLQFLYITRLESAKAIETALWKTRGSYETRNAAGVDYFVRVDPDSQRVAAFAADKGYLLLATREDLIPGALELLAGGKGKTVAGEPWYDAAVRAAGPRGELRMVMDLAQLTRSPYFRSYWVQRNVSELKQYGAGLADVVRSPSGITEKRVLLRLGQTPVGLEAEALGNVLPLVPDDAGLYRAWANPTPAAALDTLEARIIDPRPLEGRPSEMAPAAVVTRMAGGEGDLETRIDEQPVADTGGRFLPAELKKLLEGQKLIAMVEIGRTRPLADGVFVNIDSAVALVAAADWDANAVRGALSTAAETGPLGRVGFEARGRTLVIANSAALLRSVVARIPRANARIAGNYAARFNAGRERANFERLTGLIDFASAGAPVASREPPFFSGNMASLGRTLARVDSASIIVQDTGRTVVQTVTYHFVP